MSPDVDGAAEKVGQLFVDDNHRTGTGKRHKNKKPEQPHPSLKKTSLKKTSLKKTSLKKTSLKKASLKKASLSASLLNNRPSPRPAVTMSRARAAARTLERPEGGPRTSRDRPRLKRPFLRPAKKDRYSNLICY
jgi:hypothetical protein